MTQRISLDDLSADMLGLNPVEAALLGVEDLAAMRPPEPLIDGLFPEGSFAVLFGRWGTAKSFIALDWAMTIGSELPWQGREVRGGKVIYVVGEGLHGMANRANAWLQEFKSEAAPDVRFHPGAVSLTNPRQTDYLAKAAEDTKAKLVIVDTLNRGLAGGDENSSTDMGKVVMAVEKIQASGSAVLIVHHVGWNGEFRGHSSVPGAADVMIKVRKDEHDTIWLKNTKNKDAEEFEDIPLRLRQVQLPYDTSCVISGSRWDE